MRVFAAGKYMQFFEHVATQRVLGQHAFHCEFDHTLWMLIEQFLEINSLEVTHVTSVMMVELIGELATCNAYFLRVYNNDVIAGVSVRGVLGFMLAA
jgi:hypothetical protein